MAGPISLTQVDFDEIKDGLIDYLKSTKQFTDYDFNGSNLQVILNMLAYQAQLNAYSTNLIANESFLHTSTIRKNVVANARSIGYTPNSARSAVSLVDFEFQLAETNYQGGFPQSIVVQPGILFSTSGGNGNFTFNIMDPQVAAVTNDGLCQFDDIIVYEGTRLETTFTTDLSDYNQRFVLMNQNVDVTTIRVEVREEPTSSETKFYRQADNLVELTKNSRVYWIEEIDQGYYELTFGDNLFGKALNDGSEIYISYIVTNGPEANGIQFPNNFNYVGRSVDSRGNSVISRPNVTSVSRSEGGALPEDVSSIKFRATKEYAAQNRCVTTEDYDVLVRKVYPAVEDVYVYGGETLTPEPEYGRVYVSIKPTTGDTLSNLTKSYIKKSLNPYRVGSLDIVITDPDILYVEVDSLVYFDEKKTIKDDASIIATVNEALSRYVLSTAIPKFGGAFSLSKINCVIDDSDKSITRNNTDLVMRKDLSIVPNTFATYEVCSENAVKPDKDASSVQSTGFKLQIDGVDEETTFYFKNDYQTIRYVIEDEQRYQISDVYVYYLNEFDEEVKVNIYETNTQILKMKNVPFEDKDITPFGILYHETGELEIGMRYKNGIIFTSTEQDSNVIEVRFTPQDKDILSKESMFLKMDVSKSNIRAVIDTQISGS